jgi:ABC-2 type transport system ATP-binding protein
LYIYRYETLQALDNLTIEEKGRLLLRSGIEFRGVTKRFGKKVVLDGLSFSARPGEITGLLGRNGAGKTTSLRILAELERANEGSVHIDGLPFSAMQQGLVGVSINLAFPQSRSVLSQLQISALAADVGESRMREVAEITEIEKILALRCGSLSLGMLQRLSLACAIIGNPHTLVLDEPVNGLDPDGIQWLHEFLISEAALGKTVLVSSHYLHDMEKYVDHVVVIHREILWDSPWPNSETESLAEIFEDVTRGHVVE